MTGFAVKNVGMLPMVVRGRRDVPGKPVIIFTEKIVLYSFHPASFRCR